MVFNYHFDSLWHPGPALLDDLLGVRPCQHDNRVELPVGQLVHRTGGHVQEGVLAAVHRALDGRQADDARLEAGPAAVRVLL